MGFPCPMCVHNPERYEHVKGSCTTLEGCSLVANVIQHLIQRHLHICRICTEVLINAPIDKSAKRYNAILVVHRNSECLKRPWPEQNDKIEPEILSEKQQAVVLGWGRTHQKKALTTCTSNTKGTSEEEELYKNLYKALHGEPLREGGATWTYLVPGHKQDERVKAEVAEERVALKRKRDELDRDRENFRQELEAYRQGLLFFQDGQGLDPVSQRETDRARAAPFLLPGDHGDMLLCVDPKNLSLDRDDRKEEENALLMKSLRQTLLASDIVERELSDSGYASRNTDGREVH